MDYLSKRIGESKYVAIDIETYADTGKKKDAVHFKKNKIRCVGFATATDQWCYTYEDMKMFHWAEFELLMTTDKVKKIGQNYKFDAKCIKESLGINCDRIYFDTLIASKLLDENAKADLESSVTKYLKRDTWKFDYKEEHTDEEWIELCTQDCRNTYDLAMKQAKLLEVQKLENLFKVEMEVLNVFYKAELLGVPIDLEHLRSLSLRYTRHVRRLEKIIFEKNRIATLEMAVTEDVPQLIETGEFNINSPKQLCHVLFEVFGMPKIKMSKSGKTQSTDANVLEELKRQGHRYAVYITTYKHWEMLRRHIDKLIEEAIDGNIYPTFNTVGTETGRFSCKEPNLQQIPSKTTESRKIRAAFKGTLLVADYSNIELRLLAHYTRDPKLLEVYRAGGSGDLHKSTATALKITRSEAKTINFGIGYGMGPKKLAASLNITEELAKSYIDQWYKTYARVQPWKDMIVNTCKKYGFVRSIGGRKRRVNFTGVSKYDAFKLEREVINFVIQGSSADMTKLAIAALKDEDIRLQIHDEIVIYNPSDGEKIKNTMENVIKLLVPTPVDCKEVDSWDMGKG